MKIQRLCLLLFIFLLVGCPRSQTGSNVAVTGSTVEDPLDAIREGLRKPGDESQLRRVLDRVNAYAARKETDPRPDSLAPAARDLISRQYGLAPAETDYVAAAAFGGLDAAYLLQAYFFRDIAKALDAADLPPVERATAALDWCVRHVPLADRGNNPPDPPQYVVTRGYGTAAERVYVFLALLRQLGLDAVLLGDESAATDPRLCWGVGLVTDKGLAVFDARAGLPLPGPNGVGVATLAQLRGDPNLIQQLTVDPQHPYDVTPERVAGVRLYVAEPLSALAPRMKFLESLAPGAMPRLFVDATATSQKLQANHADVPWGMWGQNTVGTPPRLLAEFLPADEGGTDNGVNGPFRRQRFEMALAPRMPVPQFFAELPGPIRAMFQKHLGQELDFSRRPGLAQRLRREEFRQAYRRAAKEALREKNEMSYKALEKAGAEVMIKDMRAGDERGPTIRELILRGEWEEATNALVSLSDMMRTIRDGSGDPKTLDAEARAWCDQAKAAYAQLLRAERAADPQELAAAKSGVDLVHQKWAPAIKYVRWLASEPILAESTYLIALCKHDQAELRQRKMPNAETTKAAWNTAAQAWGRFLNADPTGPIAATARNGQARALELAGQKEACAAAYRSAAAVMSGPEKATCLYRAKTLGR